MADKMKSHQREQLIEELRNIDGAMAKLETARKPFDAAISALFGVKEFLLEKHHAEIAGTCETCSQTVFVGEQGHHDGEYLFCEKHSPTWGDIRTHALESQIDDWEEPDGRAKCLEAVQAHLANGGALSDKHVWEQ